MKTVKEELEHGDLGIRRTKLVKVIYITGWGRSGSTLLEKILGSSNKVIAVGEILFFNVYKDKHPHEKVVEDFVCNCGEEFKDCHFWRTVLKCVGSKDISLVHDTSHLKRLQWVYRFLKHEWKQKSENRSKHFLGDDFTLFREVMAHNGSQTQYVCDSSKDFARLVRLFMNPNIEVIPIHLVRDGRAVAASKAKKERVSLGLDRFGYFHALLLWISVNLIDRFIFFTKGVKPIHISYDLFCQAPEKYIRYFNKELGLEIPEDSYLEKVNKIQYHSVNGNPRRFEAITAIRYDDEWKGKISRFKFVLGTIITMYFNRQWVSTDSVSGNAK